MNVSDRSRHALKRALAARVNGILALTASLESDYQAAARRAVRIPPKGKATPSQRAEARFRADLRQLAPQFKEKALNDLTADFASRGLPLPAPDALERYAAMEVRRTIRNAADLLETLTHAAKTQAADGTFTVPTLTSAEHAERVVSSLAQNVRDNVERRAIRDTPDLTGRRKWNVADKARSRRAAMHGQIAEAGENFTDFDGKTVAGPRADPRDVARNSGSTSFLTYERINPDGSTSWV
jgi:hypothetical protein